MLKPNQFYLVYASYSKEIELLLYLFADGRTFLEASHLKKNGAELIESSPDYGNWQYQKLWAEEAMGGKLKYIPIYSLYPLLTADQLFYREFAKYFASYKGSDLHQILFNSLPFYRLFVIDFDYESGNIMSPIAGWERKSHEYELIKEGRLKFEGCKTE